MDTTLVSGVATVMDTGTVTTFGGQSLRFALSGEGAPVVEMSFATDDRVEGVAVSTEVIDGGLRFQLVNFDDVAGRGSAVPVLLGEDGDHLLFFHFRVFRYGKTEDHTVFYTFYRARKIDVGWTPVVPDEDSG